MSLVAIDTGLLDLGCNSTLGFFTFLTRTPHAVEFARPWPLCKILSGFSLPRMKIMNMPEVHGHTALEQRQRYGLYELEVYLGQKEINHR